RDGAGRFAHEARREPDGNVEALTVDGSGRQPECVVLDVRQVVGREQAGAREVARIIARIAAERALTETVLHVHPVTLLHAELQLDASVSAERVAGNEVGAVTGIFINVP